MKERCSCRVEKGKKFVTFQDGILAAEVSEWMREGVFCFTSDVRAACGALQSRSKKVQCPLRG